MKRFIVPVALLLVLSLFSGCVSTDGSTNSSAGGKSTDDKSNLIKNTPELRAFLERHPDAAVKIVYLSENNVLQNIDEIESDCGKQMKIAPYYYATVTAANDHLHVYVDANATKTLCVVRENTENTEAETPQPSSNNAAGHENEANKSGTGFEGGGSALPPEYYSHYSETTKGKIDPVEQFSKTVCDNMPRNAMHLRGGYIAVLIPESVSNELAKYGNSVTFTGVYGFVPGSYSNAPNAPRTTNYYWHCWANGGPNTHVCIIPVSGVLNTSEGRLPKTGAIKLTFTGMLEPLKSACNWTPPNVTAEPTASPYGTVDRHGGLGAPVAAASPEARTTPPNTPECASLPQRTEAERGPTDVDPGMDWYWIPGNEIAPPETAPGPVHDTPTFTRTDCQVVFDVSCPDQEGSLTCGECPYERIIDLITKDQFHPSPGKFVSNLGQCRYCPLGSRCANGDSYGICGNVACLGATVPTTLNFYIGCSSCPAGGVYSRNYPDRSWNSWASCINYYNYCYAALQCGRILDNCRGHEPT